MSDKKNDEQNKPQLIGEEYVLRSVYQFICSLEDCPYCQNKPQKAYHPSKKWCSEEAREEYRRRSRVQDAIQDKRDPKFGAKVKNPDTTPGIFYIHMLDGSRNCEIGTTVNLSGYQAKNSDKNIDFDTVIVIKTSNPDSLKDRVERSFKNKQTEDGLFDLTLPEIRIAHQMVIEHIHIYQKIRGGAEDVETHTALLVDDDRNNLLILQIELLELGYMVRSINDPGRVMDAFYALEKLDIIFLDLEMPRISGFEILSDFQKLDFDIPVVAYTAHREQLRQIKNAGFSGVIIKPLDIKKLPGMLNVLTEKQTDWDMI